MPAVVDYSYSHPQPSAIKAAGYLGAVRYLGYDFSYTYDPGANRRTISPRERDGLFAAGLDLALVWETTASMTLRGAQGGAADGAEANRQADYLGFPTSRPLYVAVDFDANASHLSTIHAYVDAFKAQGRAVLVYGEYEVIEAFGDGWQCAAWSGNGSGSGGSLQGRRLSRHARMFQTVGYVLNNTCDHNEVFQDDWGQWHYAGGSQPTTPTQPSEDAMKAVYKFPNSNELWMLCSGYIADAELENENGTPYPVKLNKVTEYFKLIPSPDDLEQLYLDGHLKRGFVRQMAAGDNALDAYWHRLPHVR